MSVQPRCASAVAALIDSAPPQVPGETEWVQNMNDAGEAYLRWFYDSGIWKNMTWGGVRTLKLPSDMWNYQEIIHERRIDYVIEAGTRTLGKDLRKSASRRRSHSTMQAGDRRNASAMHDANMI